MEIRRVTAADAEALGRLDASYSTDRVYVVEHDELALRLVERRLDGPFVKRYPFAPADATHIALGGGEVVGASGLVLEKWNRRMRLEHLYVEPAHRGRGVGGALVEAAVETAREAGARVLWCETQNVNPDAIDFYRRLRFELAGFDLSLYDDAAGEVAVFLARDV